MSKERIKNAKLKRLKASFADRLPGRLATVRKAWSEMTEASTQETAREQFHRQIHNLAGCAGSFGYPRLGEQARELELYLQRVGYAPSDADANAYVNAALSEMERLAELPDEPEFAIVSATSETGRLERTPHLVYVLEDDVDLGVEIQCQLANFGYEVSLFTRLDDIARAFDQRHPGALVVDIILPEGPLEGARFAAYAVRTAQHPVPTIFISIRDDWEARLEAIRGGGDVYLTKPLDMMNLVEQLDRLTQQEPTESIRVLILDDNAELAERYAAVLEGAGMRTKVITDPPELLEALSEFSPELVLMDLYMPSCSGVDAAKIIRQTPSYVNVPIVYLSTESELQVQLAALEIGGDDFLQKPIQDDHLVAAVENRARRFRELSALVSLDGLTGLLNHIHLSLALEAELAQVMRQGGQLVYAMIDIDRFKSINDHFGHTVGDRVIKTLARLLKHRLRAGDIAGRYGGEEYALILPDTELDAAARLVDELRSTFFKVPFIHQGQRFVATFSAGIASSLDHPHSKDLVDTADRALYAAKRQGRNRVVIGQA